MQLNVKAMALTFGILWAAAFFLVAGAQQVWPTYGVAFLELI